MKQDAVPSGSKVNAEAISEGYKMYHLIIVAILGLLVGAAFQYLKSSPAAAVIAPIVDQEVSV